MPVCPSTSLVLQTEGLAEGKCVFLIGLSFRTTFRPFGLPCIFSRSFPSNHLSCWGMTVSPGADGRGGSYETKERTPYSPSRTGAPLSRGESECPRFPLRPPVYALRFGNFISHPFFFHGHRIVPFSVWGVFGGPILRDLETTLVPGPPSLPPFVMITSSLASNFFPNPVRKLEADPDHPPFPV